MTFTVDSADTVGRFSLIYAMAFRRNSMNDKLTGQDVDVVDGDLLVSIPGDGTVLLGGDEVLRLANQKGHLLGDTEEDQEPDVRTSEQPA
jgi:hypothetical protein